MNELISLRYLAAKHHVLVYRNRQQDAEVTQGNQRSHVYFFDVLPAQLVGQIPVEHVVEEDILNVEKD